MTPLPLDYYPTLDATNSLVRRLQWSLQRCRRDCDGPLRFFVFDEHRKSILVDIDYPDRRPGFTLEEVLIQFSRWPELDVAAKAANLLAQLSPLVRE